MGDFILKLTGFDLRFKRQFKVRVLHYLRESYIIQYTSYRVYPSWKTLHFWFGLWHPDQDLACWSYQLLPYNEAEELARTIKCIDDVNNYYKPHCLARNKFWKEEEEWWTRNKPYEQKFLTPY